MLKAASWKVLASPCTKRTTSLAVDCTVNFWREVGWSAGSLRLTISAAAPRSPRMSVVARDGCPRPTQPSRSVPTCSVTFASSPLRNARDSPLPVERKEQDYGKSTQTQHRLRPWPLGRRLLLQQTHPDPSGRGT